MINVILATIVRIFSNSYSNVLQKQLTDNCKSSSVINFYTYWGLTCICLPLLKNLIFTDEILMYALITGLFGCFGNLFIIKALSCGELSSLAPINSYKPVIALIFGVLFLNEVPSFVAILGILLVVFATIFFYQPRMLLSKAYLYRFSALVFSATEAIFIKKLIILSNITSAFFYWAFSGLLFSFILILVLKYKLTIKKVCLKKQILLVISVATMQISTNYVFSKINVAYALALFQLSTLLSVFMGVKLFGEKNLLKKIITAVLMILGAVLIILN